MAATAVWEFSFFECGEERFEDTAPTTTTGVTFITVVDDNHSGFSASSWSCREAPAKFRHSITATSSTTTTSTTAAAAAAAADAAG
jgi:hypothetical protein